MYLFTSVDSQRITDGTFQRKADVIQSRIDKDGYRCKIKVRSFDMVKLNYFVRLVRFDHNLVDC